MNQDNAAQDNAKKSEDPLGGLPEESSSVEPHSKDEIEDGFDFSGLEPLLALDDDGISEPGRFRLFLRRLLRWSVTVLVIFALGIGATWLARVIPQQKEIDNLDRQLKLSNDAAQLSASEVEDLLPLVDENAELKLRFSGVEMHVEILKIQADVATAQIALYTEDFVTAKASLAGSDTRLEAIIQKLQGEDRDTVEGMLIRLELVLEELGEDSFAAVRDLEVLSSNLSALERSLFGN